MSSIIFLGWYHILDKTLYSSGTERASIGPKEHSFFITFLFHGINLWTLLSYVFARYLHMDVPLHIALSLGVTVFLIGYLIFFKKKVDKILASDIENSKIIFSAFIALIYVTLSVYLMLKVGNYVREVVVNH